MRKTLISSAIVAGALAAMPVQAQDTTATTTTTTTAAPATAATPPVTSSSTTTTTTADPAAPAATASTTTTTTAATAASFPGANGAQIKAGDTIYDPSGNVVGTVKAVDANGATVSTGAVTVGIPLTGIGPAPKGLVIALTKEQVEAQAKAATPNG